MIMGVYDAKKNKIQINNDTAEDAIYHELFHMASSTYKDGIRYSGFHQSSIKTGIVSLGKGLNEGYTELLSARYFQSENSIDGSYEYEVLVAKKVEDLIGKEKMQSLYLNSNLKGLIDELKQYTSEEEIMKFISNSDFLVSHMSDKKLQLFEKNMIYNCLKNINSFFIICYLKRLQQQYQNKEISSANEMITKLAKDISSLPFSIQAGENRYELLTDEYIQQLLQTSINNTIDNKNINKKEPLNKKR